MNLGGALRPAMLACILVLLLPAGRGAAQGLGLSSPNDRRPLDIEADNGIEWHQNEQIYVARGNARATRGDETLYADTLIAHYRPLGSDHPKDPQSVMGSTEIYLVEADGHVRLENTTDTIDGDHAVYDMDTTTGIVTGKHLRLVTPRDTVTARDSLEWYDAKQVAVARGDALAVGIDDRRLAGDVLTALVTKGPDGQSRISRIDAQGHVVVTTTTDVARGDSGVYNTDTGIATLAGDVTITRDQNVLRGHYAVVNLNTNVSRLLSTPTGNELAGGIPGRAEGLVIPRSTGKHATP